MRNKLLALFSALVIFALALSACQTAATEAPTQPAVEEPTEPPAEEPVAEELVEESAADEYQMDAYRIAILADITSSNVWNLYGPGASAYNYVVQTAYWPTLLAVSSHRFDLVPQLAAGFGSPVEEEGDFWVTTVPLKQDVAWSDGTPITAHDIVFTAQVVQDFDLSGNWDYDTSNLEMVEAVDDFNVKFYYSVKPGLATQEYGVLQNPIVQKAYWEPKLEPAYESLAALEGLEEDSDEYVAAMTEAQTTLYGIEAEGEPIYGPYAFSKWETGAFVENVANPDHFFKGVVYEEYANGAYHEYLGDDWEFTAYGEPEGEPELRYVNGPHAKSVVYSVYSQDAAVLALLNGDVDYIYNPSGYGPGLEAQLEGDPNVDMVVNPRNGWRFLGFNFRSAPLDDIAVREAITCMIDKEFLTGRILQGAALPAYTPVPPGLGFWYNPDVPKLCFGMTEQERMEWSVARLTEAGYTWDVEPTWNEGRGGSIDWGDGLTMPDGTAVPELLLLAPSPGYDPLRATSGVLIEQWAGMLGIPVKAQLTNFNNILNETLGGGGNWDMVVLGWSLTTFPDHMCDFFLEDYGGPFAFTGYDDEELRDMCVALKGSTDLDEAKQLAYDMQVKLATDLPYTYLFATPVSDAYNTQAVAFPFTDVLDGLEGLYGMQEAVVAPE